MQVGGREQQWQPQPPSLSLTTPPSLPSLPLPSPHTPPLPSPPSPSLAHTHTTHRGALHHAATTINAANASATSPSKTHPDYRRTLHCCPRLLSPSTPTQLTTRQSYPRTSPTLQISLFRTSRAVHAQATQATSQALHSIRGQKGCFMMTHDASEPCRLSASLSTALSLHQHLRTIRHRVDSTALPTIASTPTHSTRQTGPSTSRSSPLAALTSHPSTRSPLPSPPLHPPHPSPPHSPSSSPSPPSSPPSSPPLPSTLHLLSLYIISFNILLPSPFPRRPLNASSSPTSKTGGWNQSNYTEWLIFSKSPRERPLPPPPSRAAASDPSHPHATGTADPFPPSTLTESRSVEVILSDWWAASRRFYGHSLGRQI